MYSTEYMYRYRHRYSSLAEHAEQLQDEARWRDEDTGKIQARRREGERARPDTP